MRRRSQRATEQQTAGPSGSRQQSRRDSPWLRWRAHSQIREPHRRPTSLSIPNRHPGQDAQGQVRG
eukprot:scaffold2307_cov112-Pinguiococcus_pyrenoidosus.AAC.2